ncbi:MAG: hypothetical protein WCG44_04245 [bacterium]
MNYKELKFPADFKKICPGCEVRLEVITAMREKLAGSDEFPEDTLKNALVESTTQCLPGIGVYSNMTVVLKIYPPIDIDDGSITPYAKDYEVISGENSTYRVSSGHKIRTKKTKVLCPALLRGLQPNN